MLEVTVAAPSTFPFRCFVPALSDRRVQAKSGACKRRVGPNSRAGVGQLGRRTRRLARSCCLMTGVLHVLRVLRVLRVGTWTGLATNEYCHCFELIGLNGGDVQKVIVVARRDLGSYKAVLGRGEALNRSLGPDRAARSSRRSDSRGPSPSRAYATLLDDFETKPNEQGRRWRIRSTTKRHVN